MSFIGRFFLLVLVLSFGELYLLILVAGEITVLATLGLCVLTGVLGGALVRFQGIQTLKEIQRRLRAGSLPGLEIVSGLILLMIGTMLLTPGFITDTVAFLLLIPYVRAGAASLVLRLFKRHIQLNSIMAERGNAAYRPASERETVIEVEAREID